MKMKINVKLPVCKVDIHKLLPLDGIHGVTTKWYNYFGDSEHAGVAKIFECDSSNKYVIVISKEGIPVIYTRED